MKSRTFGALTTLIQLIVSGIGGWLGVRAGQYCAIHLATSLYRPSINNGERSNFFEFAGYFLVGVPLTGIAGVALGYWVANLAIRKLQSSRL